MTGYLWVGFAGGAAAFAHCLGMCGGFALHLAQPAGRGRLMARQLLWHAGKTTTYMFLGAMAGWAGAWAVHASFLPRLQDWLAYAAGGVMILMGLALIGLLPKRARAADDGGEPLGASLFRQFFREPTPGGALALGLATGLLPCPIVLAFLALSVQSASPLQGIALMGAMGAGTVWSLLLLGLTGHKLTQPLRRWGTTVAGVVLILLGSATILRGTTLFHQLLGCPAQAESQAAGGTPPCCACEGGTPPQGGR